ERERDGAYVQLEERILARDQVGAREAFFDLIKAGRPVEELVRETVRIHAPYTHVPFHQRNDSGEVRFVNNDHTLLGLRAGLQLGKLVPSEASLLPLFQAVWYIPTGLDPWNQLIGKAPGHYNRLAVHALGTETVAPAIHWPDGEPIMDEKATLQEKLDHWMTLVMRCEVEEAYRYFLGLMASHQTPEEREQVLAQLMFVGLIDVQDRTVFRSSYTTGHRAFRARATIEVAEKIGWENAHDAIYAGVLDIGIGPHWYSMYEMACTYSRVVLQGQDVEWRNTNKQPLSRAEVKQTVDIIRTTNEVTVVKHIGELLKNGKSVISIMDAIVLAAVETIIEAGSPAAYNMPHHAYEYCNNLRWFMGRFDHKHKAKLLFIAGSFVNETTLGQQVFPGNGPRPLKAPRGASGWSQQQLLQQIDASIVALEKDDAMGLTHVYLKNNFDTKPLMSVLAMAASKMGNDPHNQEISQVQLEDFARNSHAARGRLLLGAAGHTAGHRKLGDPMEAYRRFSEAFGITARQDAKGDGEVEEGVFDD
ncbi:MAG: hypothetical protein AB7P40_31125, partial [Chloroflexota bacterium]